MAFSIKTTRLGSFVPANTRNVSTIAEADPFQLAPRLSNGIWFAAN